MNCDSVISYFVVIGSRIITLIQIISPILLIIFLSFLLIKGTNNPDDKKISLRIKNTCIALFLVFIIPTLINVVLYLVGVKYNLYDCDNFSFTNKNSYIKVDKDDKKKIINNEEYEKGKKRDTNSKSSSSIGGNVSSNILCGTDSSKVEYSIEPLKEGLAIPHYLQYDKRWADVRFYDKYDEPHDTTLGENGCEYTSLAMIISYLTGNTIYPTDVLKKADSMFGAGEYSLYNVWGEVTNSYGYDSPIYTEDFNEVDKALRNGQPVMGWYKGDSLFTVSHHFVVLRGIASDGKYLVNDPSEGTYYYEKSVQINRHYSLEEIQRGAGYWYIYPKKKCN